MHRPLRPDVQSVGGDIGTHPHGASLHRCTGDARLDVRREPLAAVGRLWSVVRTDVLECAARGAQDRRQAARPVGRCVHAVPHLRVAGGAGIGCGDELGGDPDRLRDLVRPAGVVGRPGAAVAQGDER